MLAVPPVNGIKPFAACISIEAKTKVCLPQLEIHDAAKHVLCVTNINERLVGEPYSHHNIVVADRPAHPVERCQTAQAYTW